MQRKHLPLFTWTNMAIAILLIKRDWRVTHDAASQTERSSFFLLPSVAERFLLSCMCPLRLQQQRDEPTNAEHRNT